MLIYLYQLLENELMVALEQFNGLNLRDLSWLKIGVLLTVVGVCLFGFYYAGRTFSIFCQSWFDQLFDWRKLSFLGWSNFVIGSLNELKYCMCLVISSIVGFQIVSSRYLNPNQNLNELFEVEINRNDNQNVHDPTVTKHLKESIGRLQAKEKDIDIIPQSTMTVYNEIRAYLISSKHNKVKQALDVLARIHNFNDLHSHTQLREMEILRLVWQRINHPINTKAKDDLKEALLLQLADCQPDGVFLCLTGRVSRLVQTLECLDAEGIVDLKPIWALKDEMANYFGKYTDKLLKKVPSAYREAYLCLDPTPEQLPLVEKFRICLKNNLKHRFEIKYVKTGLLTQKQVNDLSKEYNEAI